MSQFLTPNGHWVAVPKADCYHFSLAVMSQGAKLQVQHKRVVSKGFNETPRIHQVTRRSCPCRKPNSAGK